MDFLAKAQEMHFGAVDETELTSDWVLERQVEFNFEATEQIVQRTNGSWLRIIKKNLKDGSMLGLHMDITELKEAEQAHQRFADTIEAISESVYLYDQDDRYVTGNSNVEKEFAGLKHLLVPGTPTETIVQAIWDHLLHDDTKTDHDAYMAALMSFHDMPRSTVTQRLKDGRWIEIIRYRTSGHGTLIIRTDISERVNQEG